MPGDKTKLFSCVKALLSSLSPDVLVPCIMTPSHIVQPDGPSESMEYTDVLIPDELSGVVTGFGCYIHESWVYHLVSSLSPFL